MAKIDKSKLGVDASHFDRASVEFLRADSPMVEIINERIMEGLNSNFKVIKDDNGHNRPFLVVEYPELHASVAMYMTSSIDEERMAIDNAIRGEHLFKSPFGLYNYISRSSIRGKLETGKMSVIDRNRFLFVTADSFVESESKALNIDDFNVGINAHYANAHNISELLALDLAGKNFTESVLSGKPELWVFKRTERQPIMFNPSAMYLSLAINAFERFDNKKLKVTPQNLLEMGDLAGDLAFVYSEYLRFNDRVRELEQKSPEVYNIFENVRYYADLTPTTFDKIQENKSRSDEMGSNKYRYIYGDPIYSPDKPIEKRITFEINRAMQQGNLTGRVNKKKVAEQISELIKAEKQVSQTLGTACADVIKLLDRVSEEKRINLSDFVYNQNFWNDFYSHYQYDNYVGSIMDGFVRKYQAMATHYERRQQDKRRAIEDKKKAEKMQVVQLTHAEKEKQARIKELKKVLENHYMELYAPAVKEYLAGKLLPCAKTVQSQVEDLCSPVVVDTRELTVGKKLVERLLLEMKSTLVMSDQIRAQGKTVADAEKKIITLEKKEQNTQMLDLVSRIALVEQKYSRTSQKKLDRQARKKIVSEVVDGLSESELSAYIDPKFEFGKNNEEILTYIQDVYMNRNAINSFAGLKARKMSVVNALVELNDPSTLLGYHLSYEAVSELHKGGAVLPNGGQLQSMEEIVAEYDAIAEKLGKKNSKPVPYGDIVTATQQRQATMKAFISDSQELMQVRNAYFDLLKDYTKVRTKASVKIYDTMRKVVEARQQETEEELTDIEKAGFKEVEKGVWVEYGTREDKEIWRGSREGAEKILKDFRDKVEPCLEWSNYVDLHEDQDLAQELFLICYPSKEQLLTATRSKVAQTKSMKDAIKTYKKAGSIVLDLCDDMDEFDTMVLGEFGYLTKASEDILESLCKWQFLFNSLGDSLYSQRISDQAVSEPWRTKIAEAYREASRDVSENALRTYNEYRKAFRERTRKVIAGYKPRVDEVQNLTYYLSKSTLKAQMFDQRAPLPKSILGENDGLVACIYTVASQKYAMSEIFTVAAGFDGTGYSDKDTYMGIRVSDLNANRRMIMGLIVDNMDGKMRQIQKEELDQERLDMLECTRHFASQGKTEREFVFDVENGLEYYLENLIKHYGDRGGVVESSVAYTFVNRTKKNKDVGRMSINYYKTLLEALPEIRQAVEDGTTFDGEVRPRYTDPLKSMHTAYNLKKKGIKPSIEDFKLVINNADYTMLPPMILEDD